MRVGVEVGGTFTDLVAVDAGKVVVTKVPSTPRSPDVGAFAALVASGIDLARIEDLGHGSTVATNAVLERKGAAVAFVATAGFRDLLFMQRHDRRNIYDLFYAKPAPPVRRKDCFEAPERLRADGSVEKALDEAAVEADLIPALRAGGYRAVAICLLKWEEPELLQMPFDTILPRMKTLHEGKPPDEILTRALKIKFKTEELLQFRREYEATLR